jgi:hypothetical protein
MTAARREQWVWMALLVGVVYVLVGRLFAAPTSHVHAWRLAAWLVSAVAYAAHMAYEHFRLRESPRLMAFHVAVAVAIGGLGLAIVGMVHAMSNTSAVRPAWLLALVLWPAVTAVPAFLVALVIGAVLARIPRMAVAD